MKQKTPKLNEAQMLLKAKHKLVERLRGEIEDVKVNAEHAISKIQGRIRIAQALIAALEKGTLKP